MNKKQLEGMLDGLKKAYLLVATTSRVGIGNSHALEIGIEKGLKQHPEFRPEYESLRANYQQTISKRDSILTDEMKAEKNDDYIPRI